MAKKEIITSKSKKSKTVNISNYNSTDNQNVIWTFESVDRNGDFAFLLDKIESDGKLKTIFIKMMEYESMTWASIKQQTHDKGKSKHHILNYDELSKEAKSRICNLHLEHSIDSIFSFALNNTLRIIGIRDGMFFRVKWYDYNHRFCPSNK